MTQKIIVIAIVEQPIKLGNNFFNKKQPQPQKQRLEGISERKNVHFDV